MIAPSLDLFSTSQTKPAGFDRVAGLSVGAKQSEAPPPCKNNAPFIAWEADAQDRRWGISQGCCNDWTCPRCGPMRARQEYGRIVEGARQLHAEYGAIYFITLTCRGADMPLADAQDNYLLWTNRLLTAARTKAKRSNAAWYYVQVTERQERGHPHSHILTTWSPDDLTIGYVMKYNKHTRRMEPRPAARSQWLADAVVSAGLGPQYDISEARTVEGTSRYVAKYLFKDTIYKTHWPKHWKRVRYSRSWPKLPDRENNAIALITRADWQRLASEAALVEPKDAAAREAAETMLRNAITKIRRPLEQDDILRIIQLGTQ